jgi:hypothetical protein
MSVCSLRVLSSFIHLSHRFSQTHSNLTHPSYFLMMPVNLALFYAAVFPLLPHSLSRLDPTHSGTRPTEAQVRVLASRCSGAHP